MAATQTLAEMRVRARRRANMETASAASFVSDDEFNEYINNGCQELFDRLQAARGHDYYLDTFNFTTVAGTSNYLLPATHFQTREFYASQNGTDAWRRVRQWGFDDYPELISQGDTGDAANIRARIVDGEIVLLPTPGAVFSVRQVFVYAFNRMTADGDQFDGISGWEEYAILHAAIAALKKEESLEQAAALEAEMGRIIQRLERLAPQRHQGEPMRVRDVRRDHVASYYPEVDPRYGDWLP